MILFKPRLDVTIEKLIFDKNDRYILAEAFVDGSKLNFLNIYAPNDRTQQVKFLSDLSTSTLTKLLIKRYCLVEISIAPWVTSTNVEGAPVKAKMPSLRKSMS